MAWTQNAMLKLKHKYRVTCVTSYHCPLPISFCSAGADMCVSMLTIDGLPCFEKHPQHSLCLSFSICWRLTARLVLQNTPSMAHARRLRYSVADHARLQRIYSSMCYLLSWKYYASSFFKASVCISVSSINWSLNNICLRPFCLLAFYENVPAGKKTTKVDLFERFGQNQSGTKEMEGKNSF